MKNEENLFRNACVLKIIVTLRLDKSLFMRNLSLVVLFILLLPSSLFAQQKINHGIFLDYTHFKDHSEYNGVKIVANETMNVFSIGYNGSSFIKSTKVFVEISPGFSLFQEKAAQDTDYGLMAVRVNMAALKIPVQIGYQFELAGTPLAISPYLGIYSRFFIWGRGKINTEIGTIEVDAFKPQSENGLGAERTNVGWTIGGRISLFDKISLQAGYRADFFPILYFEGVKDKLSGFNISLLYNL